MYKYIIKDNIDDREFLSIITSRPESILLDSIGVLTTTERKKCIKTLYSHMYILQEETPKSLLFVYLKHPTEHRSMVAQMREIVYKDTYMLDDTGSLEYIIDIGANIGMFSSYAHALHKNSKIIALEPEKDMYKYLKMNCEFIPNFTPIPCALGSGEELGMYDLGYGPGTHQFCKPGEHSGIEFNYLSKSITLSSLFENEKIPLNSEYLIKLDCEGGEWFLLDDPGCVDVIKHARQLSMELHFKPMTHPNPPGFTKLWNNYNWEVYNSWLISNFSETHKITYHHSRKRRGKGHYTLIKK